MRKRLAMMIVAVGLAAGATALGARAQDAPAPGPSTLPVSEATAFMGTWNVGVKTDQGAFALTLALEDVAGKVKATASNEQAGSINVSDISKSGDLLVLKYSANLQGQAIPVSATLKRVGDGLEVKLDFGGQFVIDGTGSRP